MQSRLLLLPTLLLLPAYFFKPSIKFLLKSFIFFFSQPNQGMQSGEKINQITSQVNEEFFNQFRVKIEKCLKN